MKFSIRRMTLDDIEQVVAIDQASFSLPWPERTFRYEVAENSASRPWVVDVDGRVAAMIVVWFIIDEAHIATVASHPEYRGCGLGQWLMLALIDKAQERGARVATLEVRISNLPAQKLYDKLGFDVVGTRRKYYRDGEDGLIMTTPPLAEPDMQAKLKAAREDALERMTRCFGNPGATDGTR